MVHVAVCINSGVQVSNRLLCILVRCCILCRTAIVGDKSRKIGNETELTQTWKVAADLFGIETDTENDVNLLPSGWHLYLPPKNLAAFGICWELQRRYHSQSSPAQLCHSRRRASWRTSALR